MKFIPFTGIDNHLRCVTFGAALIAKEDVYSYEWLLKVFKKTFPVEPQIVMTDQDPSMLIAVESVFSTARHRLCMWHITDKITNKVGYAICKKGFKSDISNIIWTDKLEPEAFERKWFIILERYKLTGHKWLSEMFNLRQKWIPAFYRDWDMSGLMRTSSRSESENHVFQQLMSRSSSLVEFITFFETAMEIQRHEQSRNDHDSINTTPDIETVYPMEKHAVKLYTRAAFYKVQGQMKAAHRYCMSYSTTKDGPDVTKFIIGDTSVKSPNIDETIDRIADPYYFDELVPRHSEVRLNRRLKEISCSCRMYERIGYFCRHIFYVFRMESVTEIPFKYVKKRWSLNAIHLIEPRNYSNSNLNGSLGMDVKQIYSTVDECVRFLMNDPDKMKVCLELVKEVKKKVITESADAQTNENDVLIPALVGLPQPKDINVHAPTGIRNKGCGKKRMVNAREEAINNKSPTIHRACKHCGEEGHNVRSCPVLKESILNDRAKKQNLRKTQILEETRARNKSWNEETSASR